ncbi:glycosyltransferase family 4 protein [Paenibacillus sp. 7124]|uniref:Glycosyltransferase family 4 protein n=1 Tax=Paenibacillus apii TaxID=1850370 RepID=A0A6M1PJG8_9BACL|nr:glycosyltransferase [Paenibacillus apii]NGM83579.1 glycosyltransferase family 4 protein [Paenibacillus apii]
MKVVIVNCFDTYEERIDLLHDFFIKKGHDVTIIQSDFRHFKKVRRVEEKTDFMFIESKPYYKNMSLARLASHYNFAKKAFKIVETLQPDLLYTIVPPNSLAKFAGAHKKKHVKVKLIFDLIDLWPETMPVGKIVKYPPFTFWKQMRDKSLKFADFIITECDLYQTVLKELLDSNKSTTIYLSRKEINNQSFPILNEDQIHLCYLGSINNIIDIPKITSLVESIHRIKPVTLHIIGDGESRDTLIKETNLTGAKVEYHGKIYDPQKKQDIFDRCHFGMNIMKDTVCVGLTMKSIDYFQHGLPIINNIQADTTEIVEYYNTGINISDMHIEEVAHMIANINKNMLLEMRQNTKQVFNEMFSYHVFEEKLNAIMKEL